MAARADPRAGHRLRRRRARTCPGPRAGRSRRASTSSGSASPTRGTEPQAGLVRRLRPGRGQRRDRRAGPVVARRRPGLAGDQPGARPLQPQARPRRHRRVRRGPGRPGRDPVRADRHQRGDPAPLARPAGRRVGHGRPAGQRRRSPAGGATTGRSSTGSARPWRWFRSADLDQVEQDDGRRSWDDVRRAPARR